MVSYLLFDAIERFFLCQPGLRRRHGFAAVRRVIFDLVVDVFLADLDLLLLGDAVEDAHAAPVALGALALAAATLRPVELHLARVNAALEELIEQLVEARADLAFE